MWIYYFINYLVPTYYRYCYFDVRFVVRQCWYVGCHFGDNCDQPGVKSLVCCLQL